MRPADLRFERVDVLIGAALLAASILPLSTAYSVCEYTGVESALDDRFRDAPLFYITSGAVTAIAAIVVLIPGAPLITILIATQVVNAILLLRLLAFMVLVSRDRDLMGQWTASRKALVSYIITIGVITTSVVALAIASFG